MYYLIRPDLTALWTADDRLYQPRSGTIQEFEEARTRALELPLEWKPTEKPLTQEHAAIALRHGIPSPSGIIIDAGHFASIRSRDDIVSAHVDLQRSRQSPEMAANEAFMDHVLPGWREDSARLDAEIDEGTRSTVAKHQARIDELLSAPLREDLVKHWRGMGGVVPA